MDAKTFTDWYEAFDKGQKELAASENKKAFSIPLLDMEAFEKERNEYVNKKAVESFQTLGVYGIDDVKYWYIQGFEDGHRLAYNNGQAELIASLIGQEHRLGSRIDSLELKLERIKDVLSSTNKNDSLDSLQYIIHSALDLI